MVTENEIEPISCTDAKVGVVELDFLHVGFEKFSVDVGPWSLTQCKLG